MLKEEHIDNVIDILRKIYKKKKGRLLFDFSTVEDTRKGDIMVLSAQIEKIKERRDVNVFRIGKKSKIIERIFGSNVLHLNQDLSRISIGDVEKFHFLQPEISNNISNELKKIGINKNKSEDLAFCERIEALLTEIVGNAIEHGIKNRRINCWLTSEIDRRNKKMIFTFVDMGLGIAKSHRKTNLPLSYRISHDSRIVQDSLHGKLLSSTKNPDRGKGLPEVKGMVEKIFVSDFELITNRVAILFIGNEFYYKKIPNFVGTYYSWSVSKNNKDAFLKWKNTQ